MGAPSWAAATTAACDAHALRAAIVAVQTVFGTDAEVVLGESVCELAEMTVVATARPEPGSRTGGPVRFLLFDGSEPRARRVGRATATVRVTVPHVRAAAAVPARAVVAEADVAVETADVGRVPFAALPRLADVVGQRVRRGVDVGELVQGTVVAREPLVRSGAHIVTLARVDGIEVRGRAVAAQNGDLGDVVLVVNPDSRKRLRGRVVADSLVEVLHVS